MVMGAEVASWTVRVSPRRLLATPRAGPDTRSSSSTMSWEVRFAMKSPAACDRVRLQQA